MGFFRDVMVPWSKTDAGLGSLVVRALLRPETSKEDKKVTAEDLDNSMDRLKRDVKAWNDSWDVMGDQD